MRTQVVTPINERSASMARHPAGKGRGVVKFPEAVNAVTVTVPLDATKKPRKSGSVRKPRSTRKQQPVEHIIVDKRVMTEARLNVRPGEKFVPVDATTVRSVYLR